MKIYHTWMAKKVYMNNNYYNRKNLFNYLVNRVEKLEKVCIGK